MAAFTCLGADASLPSLPAQNNATELPIWQAHTLNQTVGENPTLHQRLLKKFLVNAQSQVATITAAAQSSEVKTVADVAHNLKSAARTVGALALGELCQQIETAARTDTGSSALVSGLPATLDATQAAIAQHLQA